MGTGRGRAATSLAALSLVAGCAVTPEIETTATTTTTVTLPSTIPNPTTADVTTTSSTVEVEDGPLPVETVETTVASDLTIQQLRNAPVPALCDEQPGVLVDGTLPTAIVGRVDYVDAAIANLDGQVGSEAVMVTECTFGGNAAFRDALLYRPGPTFIGAYDPERYAGEFLASAEVDGSQVVIDTYGYLEFDGACCPSLARRTRWRLESDGLVDITSRIGPEPLTVSTRGIGPVESGMSILEFSDVMGGQVEGGTIDGPFRPDAECWWSSVVDDDRVTALGGNGALRSIGSTSSDAVTRNDIRVGATRAEVQAAHQEVEDFDNVYSDEPDLISYDPDGVHAVRFVMADDRLVEFMAGELDHVTLQEGCA